MSSHHHAIPKSKFVSPFFPSHSRFFLQRGSPTSTECDFHCCSLHASASALAAQHLQRQQRSSSSGATVTTATSPIIPDQQVIINRSIGQSGFPGYDYEGKGRSGLHTFELAKQLQIFIFDTHLHSEFTFSPPPSPPQPAVAVSSSSVDGRRSLPKGAHVRFSEDGYAATNGSAAMAASSSISAASSTTTTTTGGKAGPSGKSIDTLEHASNGWTDGYTSHACRQAS